MPDSPAVWMPSLLASFHTRSPMLPALVRPKSLPVYSTPEITARLIVVGVVDVG